jgi:hypothetical protein
LEAHAKGINLTVMPVDGGVTIEADRHVLGAVVENLLQNAFTFTRPRSTVTLRVSASEERVLIEILDECGSLPGEKVADLFRPFEELPDAGSGLGLAFSRWGVEANDGRIYARNLPDQGFVFYHRPAQAPGFRRRDCVSEVAPEDGHEITRVKKCRLTGGGLARSRRRGEGELGRQRRVTRPAGLTRDLAAEAFGLLAHVIELRAEATRPGELGGVLIDSPCGLRHSGHDTHKRPTTAVAY